MTITKELFDEYNVKHDGRCEVLSIGSDETEVIVRPPTGTEYDRFKVEASKAADRPEIGLNALKALTRACVVYPDKDAFSVLLDRYPAIADSYGNELLQMAGASQTVTRKKF